MGCDYYIEKVLDITYLNELGVVECDMIVLYRENGYFDYSASTSDDSDDSQTGNRERYYHYLDSKYKPRVLFDDGQWVSENVQEKYAYKLVHFKHLIKVVKAELRYFRD